MRDSILGTIHGPADVHALDADALPGLCSEIRRTLIAFGREHGGHIGSNLGLVEATVALHRVFDSPRDRIVFDVSHQSYVHKMLTGRASAYLDPALHDSVTGFTNPEESEHDQFVLGHTGTSISLACGLAKARDMAGERSNVIAVIGDGSLSSAIAFEGLNNAVEQGGNLIIVFNDNEMSIAEDSGGMYGPLARLRASGGTSEPNIFRAFGLDYRYVERGNDVAALVRAFREVKDIDHPVVVHIHTVKGLGLPETASDEAAEPQTPTSGRCEANHWQNPDSAAGQPAGARKHYGQLAMAALEPRFAQEPGLVVISPATPGSNGITRAFRERAGRHYVDTGITEEHAVAFASGIARAGGRPVLATSATFFQRTFDQLQQELALNGTPATLLDFGGGLSGADNNPFRRIRHRHVRQYSGADLPCADQRAGVSRHAGVVDRRRQHRARRHPRARRYDSRRGTGGRSHPKRPRWRQRRQRSHCWRNRCCPSRSCRCRAASTTRQCHALERLSHRAARRPGRDSGVGQRLPVGMRRRRCLGR